MGLSKRAKRGIGIFNHINQKSSKRWLYSAKRITVPPPQFAANIVEAAGRAMAELPEEMRNAYIPEISVKEDNAIPAVQEVGEEQHVHLQQEAGSETPQGTETSPEGV